MDITAYLERINYHGSLEPSAQTLRGLQLAHLLTVPFENLSIHWKQPIVLSDDALFEKIVTRRRGGFCYELNGLFAALLRELGFNVDMLSARVFNSAGELGPDFDHMTLLVTLDERWLADIGFGDSFNEPLLLDKREEQIQGERSYLIIPDASHLILRQRDASGEWNDQYQFSLQPHTYPDYEEMCLYHQTSPQSHFTRGRICSRATSDGRISLSDMRFISTVGNVRHERMLGSDEEYATVLHNDFGIEVP